MSKGLKPCPFCGKKADLEDYDTLYPSGTGWKFDEELECRTYHRAHDVPVDQWCYSMHCPVQAGGCGAEVHGDTRGEALNNWNKRSDKELTDLRARLEKAELGAACWEVTRAWNSPETISRVAETVRAAIAKERT